MNGRARSWTAGLLFAVAAAPAVVHAELDPRYANAVQAYARGERNAAVGALGGLPSKVLDEAWRTLQRQAKAVEACPECPDPFAGLPVRAVVMLHVDRDAAERPPGLDVEATPTCAGPQARRAGQIAGLLARRRETRDFARRFYVAMALRSQWRACLEEAVGWGRDGLDHFPGDADLLFGVGASFEKAARIVDSGQVLLLRQALEPLRKAVAAAPERADVGIHLGRVQWRLDQLDDARRTLEAAAAAARSARDLYLASLFLGQVHERAGRSEAAAAAFRAALGARPHGQSATVALAQLLLSSGDAAAARELIESAMSRAGHAFDPHWNYSSDLGVDHEQQFEALRLETRQ